MLLDAVNKSIEVLLDANPVTNQLVIVSFFVDHTTTTATPAESDGVTVNPPGVATAVAAPAAATQRQVKLLSIYNADTVSATVTVQLNNAATRRIMKKTTLNSGDTLIYQQEQGWYVVDSQGIIKGSGSTVVRSAPLMMNPIQDKANITTVTVFATGVCQVLYIGVAPFATSSINLLVNVTALVATITWAEIAIYKGTPTLNGACPDLTRLGWTDVSAVYNTTGRKNTNIALTIAAQVGEHLWVVLGSSATTPFQIRGCLADDLQTGLFNTLTARPSLTPGPIAGTLGGAAAVPGWVAIKVN